MEKIININIAGQLIAIEDGAYRRLTAYIGTLRSYFAGEEGSEEILADIESRIAELMSEKIKRGSLAITEADITDIIAGMGSAEDFAAADARESSAGTASAPNTARMHRRFFRDVNDKFLGGVCSGLASYLNVDPALVRIVFAILTLGGLGSGVLLYIVLWIFVPAAPLQAYSGRRLFRNGDDKWIGGVCSGLGAYFGKDPLMFRGIFAIPLLLSIFSESVHFLIGPSIVFGSLTGTFLLIYIVLWIVLPLASSDFEKMEMRGEKVDLASIRQNVQTAMGGAGERMREWSGEVRDSVSRLASGPVRTFTSEASAAARPIASKGFHIIGLLLRIFLLCIAGLIAFVLFATLIVYSFSGASTFVNHFFLGSAAQVVLGWATIILFFGVPLVGLITWLVRRIMRVRSRNRYLGWTFGGLWAIGFICAIVFAASLSQEFRSYEKVSGESITLNPAGKRLVLDVPGEAIRYGNSLPWLHSDDAGWDIDGDTILTANVNIHTLLSPDSLYHVRISRYASGRNREEAQTRAGSISYMVSATADSVLSLSKGYTITAIQKYRGQRVMVEVEVPKGGKLRLSRSVTQKLFPHVFVFRNDGYNRNYIEFRDAHFTLGSDVDYVMGDDGRLSDPMHPGEKIADALTQNQHYDDWRESHAAERSQRIGELRDDSAERARERKADSLDREINRIEREKEKLED